MTDSEWIASGGLQFRNAEVKKRYEEYANLCILGLIAMFSLWGMGVYLVFSSCGYLSCFLDPPALNVWLFLYFAPAYASVPPSFWILHKFLELRQSDDVRFF